MKTPSKSTIAYSILSMALISFITYFTFFVFIGLVCGDYIYPQSFIWTYEHISKIPELFQSRIFSTIDHELTFLYFNDFTMIQIGIILSVLSFAITTFFSVRFIKWNIANDKEIEEDIKRHDEILKSSNERIRISNELLNKPNTITGIVYNGNRFSLESEENIDATKLAFQIGNPELLVKSGSPKDFHELLKNRSKIVKEIRENSPKVEFPEKGILIRVQGHVGPRGFWVDKENNVTYFQLSTCSCEKCDNIVIEFKPANEFSYVISGEHFGDKPCEVYAEIKGFPEINDESISKFLNKSISLP